MMKRFLSWLRETNIRFLKRLGVHFHDPKLFVVGRYCVVKCTECGNESIPWEIPLEKQQETERLGHHRDDAREMTEIDRKVRSA